MWTLTLLISAVDLLETMDEFTTWDRFAPGREAALPKSAYLPFGAGPRVCIGNHFALMEAHLLSSRSRSACGSKRQARRRSAEAADYAPTRSSPAPGRATARRRPITPCLYVVPSHETGVASPKLR